MKTEERLGEARRRVRRRVGMPELCQTGGEEGVAGFVEREVEGGGGEEAEKV